LSPIQRLNARQNFRNSLKPSGWLISVMLIGAM